MVQTTGSSANIESKPQRGGGKKSRHHSIAPGLARISYVWNRWFALPANFHDASGVRPPMRPQAAYESAPLALNFTSLMKSSMSASVTDQEHMKR